MLASCSLDVFDTLLTKAFACSGCLSHLPLLSGHDEPTKPSQKISLFGTIGADVRYWYYAHSVIAEQA